MPADLFKPMMSAARSTQAGLSAMDKSRTSFLDQTDPQGVRISIVKATAKLNIAFFNLAGSVAFFFWLLGLEAGINWAFRFMTVSFCIGVILAATIGLLMLVRRREIQLLFAEEQTDQTSDT